VNSGRHVDTHISAAMAMTKPLVHDAWVQANESVTAATAIVWKHLASSHWDGYPSSDIPSLMWKHVPRRLFLLMRNMLAPRPHRSSMKKSAPGNKLVHLIPASRPDGKPPTPTRMLIWWLKRHLAVMRKVLRFLGPEKPVETKHYPMMRDRARFMAAEVMMYSGLKTWRLEDGGWALLPEEDQEPDGETNSNAEANPTTGALPNATPRVQKTEANPKAEAAPDTSPPDDKTGTDPSRTAPMVVWCLPAWIDPGVDDVPPSLKLLSSEPMQKRWKKKKTAPKRKREHRPSSGPAKKQKKKTSPHTAAPPDGTMIEYYWPDGEAKG
jgi:hypothetical protein